MKCPIWGIFTIEYTKSISEFRSAPLNIASELHPPTHSHTLYTKGLLSIMHHCSLMTGMHNALQCFIASLNVTLLITDQVLCQRNKGHMGRKKSKLLLKPWAAHFITSHLLSGRKPTQLDSQRERFSMQI